MAGLDPAICGPARPPRMPGSRPGMTIWSNTGTWIRRTRSCPVHGFVLCGGPRAA